MFESYGFEAGSELNTVHFVSFNDLRGMKCVSVIDTASVSYDIQSTTNPFFDGQQFQARRAQGREMEITFVYDYTISPEEADAELFKKIHFGLSQKEFSKSYFGFRFFKIKNGVKKVILCAIKSIDHQVYEEEPQLHIVLSTEPFWRGKEEEINLTRDQRKDVGDYAAYTFSKTKGSVATDFMLRLKLTPNTNAFPLTVPFEINMYVAEDETRKVDNIGVGSFRTGAISTAFDAYDDYVNIDVGWAGEWGKKEFIFMKYPKGGNPSPLYDTQKVNFPQLYHWTETFLFDKGIWEEYLNLEVTVVYTPLYIR